MRREQLGGEDAVTDYLNSIGEVDLLTAEDERQLAQQIEAGVEARLAMELEAREEPTLQEAQAMRDGALAKDHFIRANLRLVVSVAKKYPLPHGVELLDLVQEGNIGLEHAVDKFDWRKGFKFSTYATYWIRQAISRSLHKSSLVRVPIGYASDLSRDRRAAEREGTELDAHSQYLLKVTTHTSLDRKIGEDGKATVGDMIADPQVLTEDAIIDRITDPEIVREALNLIGRRDERSRYAVELYFGLFDGRKRTFREVGAELGVTGEMARIRINRALSIVRAQMANQ